MTAPPIMMGLADAAATLDMSEALFLALVAASGLPQRQVWWGDHWWCPHELWLAKDGLKGRGSRARRLKTIMRQHESPARSRERWVTLRGKSGPDWLWHDRSAAIVSRVEAFNLPPGPLAMLLTLAREADADGSYRDHFRSLARFCGIAGRTAKRHMRHLMDAGLVLEELDPIVVGYIYRLNLDDKARSAARAVGQRRTSNTCS